MSLGIIDVVDETVHEELIDLVCARYPHLPREEVAFPFNPSMATGRTVVGARLDGRLVGFGILVHLPFLPDTEHILRVVVAPESEGQRIGADLRSHLLRLVPDGTTALRVGVIDDEPRSLAIARHWGYEINVHSMSSKIDLPVGLTAPEPPEDVSLHLCPTLEFDDDASVRHMFRVCQTDPEAQRGEVMSLDQMRTTFEGATPLNILARVDGVPAAISISAITGPTQLITYTGVDPAFRGQGLAKLVKQHVHAHGAAGGARECRTANVEENVGIRRINAELGYVVTDGVYRMVQHLP